MSQELTAEHFWSELDKRKSEAELKKYDRFFPRANRGNDEFIGVRMGDIFKLAKIYMAMPLDEVENLLESPVHEMRVGAVSILDYQARDKKTTEGRKKELFDLYIRRHDRINTWDLVDRSGFWVIGNHLLDKPRDILYKLAQSKYMAERRTAIIATGQIMMKKGETDDTFKIAELLLADKEDLIHKAVGWMLRVAGDVNPHGLLGFLDKHAAQMPRVMLRYCTEKLSPEQRKHYMAL
jgi:3-methyladenine DNA glycosylase AlkD